MEKTGITNACLTEWLKVNAYDELNVEQSSKFANTVKSVVWLLFSINSRALLVVYVFFDDYYVVFNQKLDKILYFKFDNALKCFHEYI